MGVMDRLAGYLSEALHREAAAGSSVSSTCLQLASLENISRALVVEVMEDI